MLRLYTQAPFIYRFGLYAALMAAAAIAFAYGSEYFYGLKPCKLCIYQRVPYMLIIGLSFFTIYGSLLHKTIIPKLVHYISAVVFALFLTEIALAFYHMGVEYHWFENVSGCEAGLQYGLRNMTLEEIRNATMVEAVRCDKPAFVFLGLSMAGWNMVYALGCFVVLLWFYVTHSKDKDVA